VVDNAWIKFYLLDLPTEPKSFEEAFDYPDFEHRIK
jgi:hypothetical protein